MHGQQALKRKVKNEDADYEGYQYENILTETQKITAADSVWFAEIKKQNVKNTFLSC